MTLMHFAKEQELVEKTELDKLRFFSYYHHRTENISEFSQDTAISWFEAAGFHAPNGYRLMSKASDSRYFVKGKASQSLRLHARELAALDELLANAFSKSNEVEVFETVLPTELTLNTRSYLHSLALQINSSYQHNLFDGCAILMRRLLEILLIHAHDAQNLGQRIRSADNSLKPLEQIIGDVTSGQGLTVSRDTINSLDDYRTLGNYSAHKIHYICRRSDIEKVGLQFRATVEELLFLSGIKK